MCPAADPVEEERCEVRVEAEEVQFPAKGEPSA